MGEGGLQSAFNAGELAPQLYDRTDLKYWSTGCSYAENIEIAPQGGFRQRDGMRAVGALQPTAQKIFPFKDSNGNGYDVVMSVELVEIWGASSMLEEVTFSGLTADILPELTVAQRLDTLVMFHAELQTKRLFILSPTSWSIDNLPYENLPRYDYGGPIGGGSYTNGVSAVWNVEFVGLTDGTSVFTLTVNNEVTVAITISATAGTNVTAITNAIEDLPGVSDGITVGYVGGDIYSITFDGAGNEGDGWAVSGQVINKDDAAILAARITEGVAPGETIISADRGWPRCGCFYGQRLLVGGLASLPNVWMASAQGNYFNFDERLTDADGPLVVPMDGPGGETILAMVPARNLDILTSEAEYWIAERAISATTPPSHVVASTHGSRLGVTVAQSEGALIFTHANGGVLSEFRYTDVEGNYISQDLSLLASHLIEDVVDLGMRRATQSRDGNQLFVVQGDGKARQATILCEQDVTAFSRLVSAGDDFIAVGVNPRNEGSFIMERPDGRRLERMEDGLLLDDAITLSPGSATLNVGSRYNNREIWVLGDGHVLGPFTPTDGTVTLAFAVDEAIVGVWSPPIVTTLPLSREVAPGRVHRRKGRVHTVRLQVADTTSLAISANGGPLRDVPLRKWGDAGDVPELTQGRTGEVVVGGLYGYADDPTVTISQLRPGRLNVRSIMVEAKT